MNSANLTKFDRMTNTDHAQLSLAVARILYPQYEWDIGFKPGSSFKQARANVTLTCVNYFYVDYRDDATLGKMAVFHAEHGLDTASLLVMKDRNRALAEAIKEIGNG